MNDTETTGATTRSGFLCDQAIAEISETLRRLLADVFCLYMKTKSFHWHMTGSHFRDYHVLLDEQAEQVFAMTDAIAERGRKIGGKTLRSVGDISRRQRLKDNDEEMLTPQEMLLELAEDNSLLVSYLREAHEISAAYNDVATTSLIEVWIDETEKRKWFLMETTRRQ